MESTATIEAVETEESNIIYSYSWDDAVKDGTFRSITNLMKNRGFKIPVAVTNNLFHQIIAVEENEDITPLKAIEKERQNIMDIADNLFSAIKQSPNNESMMTFSHNGITLWATIEARNPKNPEPVMTIMLPEDY